MRTCFLPPPSAQRVAAIAKPLHRRVARSVLPWLAVLLAGPAAAAGLSPSQATRVDSAVTALIERLHVPGLSIAIVADHEVRWQKAYGLADVENRVAVTPATVFRIASVSKPVTAVGAMLLVERKALDLDAPIQKYAPAFPTRARAVTARHLLTHQSGIRHYRAGEAERTTRYETLASALDIFANDSLDHEPGAKVTYSTFAFTLLGIAMEGASGMTFADYMRERVFAPAGMTRTQPDDPAALVPNRARGYTPLVYARFDGQWRNAPLMDSSYKLPGGGLLSSAEDLARFAIALQKGTLLGRPAFAEMTKPTRTRDGKESIFGLGWHVGVREGPRPDRVLWHGGVQAGFTSELWMLPDRGFAVAILTNLEGGGRLGLNALARDIAAIVLP